MTTRAEAYLTAWTKTEGREFDFDGSLVLSEEERALLKAAEHQDFVEAFRAYMPLAVAKKRLEMIFRGDLRPKSAIVGGPEKGP